MDQNDFMGLLGKVKKLRSGMGHLEQKLTKTRQTFTSEHFKVSIDGHGQILALEQINTTNGDLSKEIWHELKALINKAYSNIEEQKQQALMKMAQN